MNTEICQVNLFDIFEAMEDVKKVSVDTLSAKRIYSLAREKDVREQKSDDGYTDCITMGLIAKIGSIKLDNCNRQSSGLYRAENEVFKKLNTYYLNKYYADLFVSDECKFNETVKSIKELVNDKYIFIENIVKDNECSGLKGSRPRVRPVGLRVDIKDHLGYTVSIYTNSTYTGDNMNNQYIGDKRRGFNNYFLRYKEIFPMFLYLKLIREYIEQESEIRKEYQNSFSDAVEKIRTSKCISNSLDTVCNFLGIDIIYSLKQFVPIFDKDLTPTNLNMILPKYIRFKLTNRCSLDSLIDISNLLVPLFRNLLEDYCKSIKCIEYEIERERISRSEYAASYQDKKSTNKKYLDAAEKSSLNKYFEKIEIDTDVDLKLFSDYERQIAYFRELFGIKIEGLELRLRKLGKHRAAGLFFPHANCICVDIKNPSSFVHEFFHALDYNKGTEFVRCHSFAGFKHIYRLYTNILDNAVGNLEKESVLKKRLLGNSKYNIDYYKDTYEVFARCGEIYFHEVYGDKYSISGELLNESIFYPINDKKIVNEIIMYFKDLFKRFKEESIEYGKRVSSF